MIFQPGDRYHYSNPGMAALAWAVTASLKDAPEKDIRALLSRMYVQMGIPDSDWKIGYTGPTEIDGLTLYANWGGANFTARATARIGHVLMENGAWSEKAVLRQAVITKMLADAGTPKPDRTKDPASPASGLACYSNNDGNWQGIPRDAFAGAGAGQELLFVVPSEQLVVVRYGRPLTPDGKFWSDALRYVFRPAVDAVTNITAAPYPQSAVIRKVTFDPAATVTRKAAGSDNFPLTWAKDGDLYTSWGDGWGFEPLIDKKLSIGMSKLSGGPADYQATNIRSDSIERTGEGRNGPKASGLLSVGGNLYMWVRNVDNSQLVWSEDLGKTWTWGFRFETGFGSPSFLNFGRDYSGARDEYVYAYSQSGPSAYATDDGVVLARAPKAKLRERSAWEFFVRAGKDGRADWTRDIARSGPVFSFPDHVQRVDAIYHPGLERYLLAVGYNHSSGWGLYDAPEPWGPWTMAFHTERWDMYGTHGYRLTPKWSARDGSWMSLVFSGLKENDAFCVRRMNLEIAR